MIFDVPNFNREKREARSEKREARSEKREARSGGTRGRRPVRRLFSDDRRASGPARCRTAS
ncbi:hypothetical protein DF121_00640 [Burkholderia stagnalis]|nr:hypothetical protein DF145_08265 [Burkholderia stagnalis]RQY06161.1 hypothetical protein DF121_00640 [Burkholderia stagnalis]RQY24566.1 hypothetical protein DF115_02400 [Burkholderia stagnalis]RQY37480.1 hypothetical protein DF114_02400 [Burkholderia stagnalis]